MKCKSCGANLQIDNEVCPYCGIANPVAKKHREDMKKYSKDYSKTKKEVITKSKKVNERSVRIAVGAITFAAVLLSVFLDTSEVSVRHRLKNKAMTKDHEKYYAMVEDLIQYDDYFKISELVHAHNLYDSSITPLGYAELLRADTNYASLCSNIMKALEADDAHIDTYASYISHNLWYVDIYLHDNDVYSKVYDAKWLKFADDLQRDTKLVLATFLNIPEEEYDELVKLSEAQRAVRIKEAIDEIK